MKKNKANGVAPARRDNDCDPQTVQLFLDDQLNRIEYQAFEDHLDRCATCQQAIEQQAAEESWWDEARDHLLPNVASQDDTSQNGGDTAAWDDSVWVEWASDGGDVDVEALPGHQPLNFLAPTDDPRMLGRLGSYEIAGLIGSGGMGLVLKAFDSALDRYVAVKVLAPHLATSGAARRRFAREAKAAAAIVHENVIEIHGVADANGLPYLVMPYVRGASLEKRLQERGPLRLIEILRIGRQTAAGLAAAHAQGLVHRDVKPANILLAEGVERVKLTDFGLARAADDASLTRSGVIAGTPQYMSPEQARGDAVDHRSDLFSLGSILYTACTGRPPFRAETAYGVLQRLCESEPRPIRELNPEIPYWLIAIINKLHAKSPADRFQSATEVADLFEQSLAYAQQPAAQPMPKELKTLHQESRPPRHLRLAVAATLLGIAVAVGLLANRPNQEPAGGALPNTKTVQQPETGIETEDISLDWNDGVLEQLNELGEGVDGLESALQFDAAKTEGL